MAETKQSNIEFGTSYFGIRDPITARRDLDRFDDAGLNAVLHTFSERDRKYYTQTMSEIVTASQDRGMTVYMNPWGVGNFFGGEAPSNFTSHQHEATQRLSSGERTPAACFNAPSFQAFMKDWIISASNTGADVLFWDEPHWFEPRFREKGFTDNAWVCRCFHCRDTFESQHGSSMPDTLTDRIRAFRSESLVQFLRTLTETAADNGTKNALCVAPDPTTNRQLLDLEKLSSLEHLDILGATPFWDLHGKDANEFVGSWAEQVTTLAEENNLDSQLWIQGFNLDDSSQTLENVKSAVRTALSYEPDSLFLWGWDGCRIMSALACESPATIWEAYLGEVAQYTNS